MDKVGPEDSGPVHLHTNTQCHIFGEVYMYMYILIHSERNTKQHNTTQHKTWVNFFRRKKLHSGGIRTHTLYQLSYWGMYKYVLDINCTFKSQLSYFSDFKCYHLPCFALNWYLYVYIHVHVQVQCTCVHMHTHVVYLWWCEGGVSQVFRVEKTWALLRTLLPHPVLGGQSLQGWAYLQGKCIVRVYMYMHA